MDLLGRALTVVLRCADLLRISRLQLTAARLLHRYYKVGGMAVEAERSKGLLDG
jgi:hypothetical protein